ncbi:MAG TPA: DUF4239 domain-containing protein [Pyrinomonadaceae bacterium]
MQTLLLGMLVVGVSMLLTHVGLRLVRHKVPLSVLETHHEVAGFIIGVLGAIYAVLLAFVVVVMWDQYGDAKEYVEREANQVNNLSRMAEGFPDPMRQRVMDGLRNYAQLVLDEEWATMAHGKAGQRTQEAVNTLWEIYREIDPQTNRESALYDQSLDSLKDMSNSRRLRIQASADDLPTIVQVMLWGGGLITIAFTYFFGVKSVRSQALMTAALAAIVAFILFLIIALDNPFRGYVRVSPEPMQQTLETIKAASSK